MPKVKDSIGKYKSSTPIKTFFHHKLEMLLFKTSSLLSTNVGSCNYSLRTKGILSYYIVFLSSSNIGLGSSYSRLKDMLSLSYMSSFFASLESFLEYCSFRTFSNSSACIVVLSMIAYISLLRFFEPMTMFAIMLASILVSIIGNCICRASLPLLIYSFNARNNSLLDGFRNFS